jgi:hypothetical protein
MEAARERCCDELTDEGELLCGVPTPIIYFVYKVFLSYNLVDIISSL